MLYIITQKYNYNREYIKQPINIFYSYRSKSASPIVNKGDEIPTKKITIHTAE